MVYTPERERFAIMYEPAVHRRSLFRIVGAAVVAGAATLGKSAGVLAAGNELPADQEPEEDTPVGEAGELDWEMLLRKLHALSSPNARDREILANEITQLREFSVQNEAIVRELLAGEPVGESLATYYRRLQGKMVGGFFDQHQAQLFLLGQEDIRHKYAYLTQFLDTLLSLERVDPDNAKSGMREFAHSIHEEVARPQRRGDVLYYGVLFGIKADTVLQGQYLWEFANDVSRVVNKLKVYLPFLSGENLKYFTNFSRGFLFNAPSRYGTGETQGIRRYGRLEKGSEGRNYRRSFSWIELEFDRIGLMPEKFTDIVLVHEVVHALDPHVNFALVYNLHPRELSMWLLSIQRALWHPDWGALDGSVEALFTPLADRLSDHSFFEDEEQPISREEFLGTVSHYARDVIVQNGFETDEDDNLIDLYTFLLNKVSPQRHEAVFAGTLKRDKEYPSLDSFLRDQGQGFVSASQDLENRRARLTMWGLRRYQKEFSSTIFPVWLTRDTPVEKKNAAETWFHYCKNIIPTAVLYHAFLNGEEVIINLFSQEEQRFLRERILFLRQFSRIEFTADAVAYASVFRTRLEPNPWGELASEGDLLLRKIAGLHTP